ncbi:MFS transporter [Microvirga guangxiensis]|uniref:Sugar transporter n=1 Tax=Microvirga guangxiensis TaxID=549386 RepID=A0A1G5KMB2_9HYPH|nr:MFS transporter [Microvirga guangxiensis]SCZ01079.1 Sugar transporter [Microvirga guangxiensis]
MTATAVVGMVTSLLISAATRRIDRRVVVLAFSVLLIASDVLVAVAANLPFLLLGRVMLGPCARYHVKRPTATCRSRPPVPHGLA